MTTICLTHKEIIAMYKFATSMSYNNNPYYRLETKHCSIGQSMFIQKFCANNTKSEQKDITDYSEW